MDKAGFAELVLAPVCGRQKATEIVGDLLEHEAARRGSFWMALLSVLASSLWRWIAGIVLAGTSMLYGLVHYINAFQAKPSGAMNISWGIGCALVATCVWSAVVLNALRYGLRCRTTLVGLGFTSVFVAAACLKALPSIPPITAAAALGYGALCITIRPLRASFVTLIAAAAAHGGLFFLLMKLIVRPPVSSALGIELPVGWFLSSIVEAIVLTWVRQFSLRRLQSA